MRDLPGPGLKPMFPALAGGFLTTAPSGKPTYIILWDALGRGQQTFSVDGQIVHILGCAGHMSSATTTQMCPYKTKAVIDNKPMTVVQ